MRKPPRAQPRPSPNPGAKSQTPGGRPLAGDHDGTIQGFPVRALPCPGRRPGREKPAWRGRFPVAAPRGAARPGRHFAPGGALRENARLFYEKRPFSVVVAIFCRYGCHRPDRCAEQPGQGRGRQGRRKEPATPALTPPGACENIVRLTRLGARQKFSAEDAS